MKTESFFSMCLYSYNYLYQTKHSIHRFRRQRGEYKRDIQREQYKFWFSPNCLYCRNQYIEFLSYKIFAECLTSQLPPHRPTGLFLPVKFLRTKKKTEGTKKCSEVYLNLVSTKKLLPISLYGSPSIYGNRLKYAKKNGYYWDNVKEKGRQKILRRKSCLVLTNTSWEE